MVEIINGSKQYDDLVIFENVDLTLEKGLFYIIHGPSGSGKTTLLNIIAGLENLDSGSISLDGTKYPKAFSDEKMFRYNISIVFQDFLLIPYQTVKENLLIALEYSNKTNDEKDNLINESLSKINLLDKKDVKVSKLSGGQQQRIALIRGILKEHKILTLDEPTGNLDDEAALEIMSLVTASKSNEQIIVMVTHDKRLFKYADMLIDIESISKSSQ